MTATELRELDAEIHREVMGKRCAFDGGDLWDAGEDGCYGDESEPVPHYSTDIAAAWRVVERLRNNGWYFQLSDAIELNEWIARLTSPFFPPGGEVQDVSAMDANASAAVCRAALLAAARERGAKAEGPLG